MKPRNILLIFGAVVAIWGLNWIMLCQDVQSRGINGDMFGVINSLFSGLAFAGLIISIFIQQSQINGSKRDVDDVRRIQTAQVNALERAAEISKTTKLIEMHLTVIIEQQRKLSGTDEAMADQGIRDEIDASKSELQKLYAKLKEL